MGGNGTRDSLADKHAAVCSKNAAWSAHRGAGLNKRCEKWENRICDWGSWKNEDFTITDIISHNLYYVKWKGKVVSTCGTYVS